MKNIIKASLRITLILIILCGLAYPLLITGIGKVFFATKAEGSLVKFNGQVVGSKLIGQNFTDERFFRGRVSAVNYNTYKEEDKLQDKDGKVAYSGVASGSQNLAPSNPALAERVSKDMEEFLKSHSGLKKEDIPTDLLTSSGSGLDPDITPESAKIQVAAISKASGISKEKLENLISKHTEERALGVFGEKRVNVLMLNLEIADILKAQGKL
ncbi:K(+)-transporting ATPase subunit C [Clostridium manihotivorum]|uniref:Potassium-transporting ATPase KdpC subunit n=1 Tax=Clostridium manihotivorum TaxID=2320868 RepID=A0A3R5TH36_9CLOT|nr:K(+)-transporting ATPase subunit C [Clostridium manihotivorum]QAA33299.1 K(+)-transporting ATPase subunit C [Clostridium manihotivorum]